MISRVLVPNRGEIAVRIARSCREMGIETVLGHSAEDSTSYAAKFFDDLVLLGDGSASETYLNVAKVIDAAKRAGCDAIHPGYGFLSERAELAAACDDAGIVFIGPAAESIEKMGSKAESRKLMESLGVPVVPGYHGDDQSDERLKNEALGIGFPLLVKASAGGGGKGMKVVRNPEELQAAFDSARREALKSFGDARLLLERYIENPRHVEFQIFGDHRGGLVHLYERDCSLQRRHQKVIEESPAPSFPEELRQRMAAAALTAAGGVQYRNAGTVEFIVTPEGEFYFLEMNTRLQVEHPVTELVVGVDLVRAQMLVASGAPLPWTQKELGQRGHAIECRIYAEDADNGFLPQSGRIQFFRPPSGPGIRIDSGVETGSEVTISYDPMLAKLIAYAENRDSAISRLEQALGDLVVLGTRTNGGYLRRVIRLKEFRAAEIDTSFLERHRDKTSLAIIPEIATLGAALFTIGRSGATLGPATRVDRNRSSVWETLGSVKI